MLDPLNIFRVTHDLFAACGPEYKKFLLQVNPWTVFSRGVSFVMTELA